MTAWGFLHLNHQEIENQIHSILSGSQPFCPDAMNDETLQQKTTQKGRKSSQLQDRQRQEGGGEHVWDISYYY